MRAPILLLAAALLASCNTSHPDTAPTMCIKKPVKVIEELSDSTFFDVVRCIKVHDNKIYFTENNNNGTSCRIVRLDSAYNVDLKFGHTGRGPGEFIWLQDIDFNGDTIYANDLGAKKINLFNMNGKYIKSISYSIDYYGSSRNFIIGKNQRICYTKSIEPNPINLWNPYNNDEPALKFGTQTPECKGVNPDNEDYFLVKKDDNSLFAVCTRRPLALEYDFSGNLLNQIDFSDSHYFESALEEANKLISENDPARRLFFEDGCIANNKLYLLGCCSDYEKFYVNIIFVVDIKGNKPKLLHYISLGTELKEALYDHFTVDGDRLIAFDVHSCTLHFYDLRQMMEEGTVE